MGEKRQTNREKTPSPPISTFVKFSDGTVLEGVVQDISDRGARISGPVKGLRAGDEVQLVLVVQGDQKIRYRCEVKHVDGAKSFYGLVFESRPQLIKERATAKKRCVRCDREYEAEWKFCGLCGYELAWIPTHLMSPTGGGDEGEL